MSAAHVAASFTAPSALKQMIPAASTTGMPLYSENSLTHSSSPRLSV